MLVHSIERFDLSFKNSAGLTDGGGVTRIAVRIVKKMASNLNQHY